MKVDHSKLQFDYSKLLGRIKEFGFKQEDFASVIGTSASTLSLKLNSRAFFTQKEMEKARAALEFDKSEMGAYFFTLKVQNS